MRCRRRGRPPGDAARFNATLCLAHPDGRDVLFVGKVDGMLRLAAARREGVRVRPGVHAGWIRHHLRRDAVVREAIGSATGEDRLSHRARAFSKFVEGAIVQSDRGNGLFGVYVHWPFCAAKCPYCDFNSHVHRGAFDEAAYVESYARELAHFAEKTPGRTVQSVFFGGGTPSLMDPRSVEGILRAISKHWRVANDAEVTLEANPTSVEAERFRGYRAAGVNRVSLGVQSLRRRAAAALGRMHTVDEAVAAVRLAQSIFRARALI